MNWHICQKRKLLFLFVFSTYLRCHHHVFSGISYFWGSEVHQKYAVWVLIGRGIKLCIQWSLPLEIWVKKQGDMSKIRTKKIVFFYDKYLNSTIMVDSFYWNSIGSWIPTQKFIVGAFSYKAHFRPQISSNAYGILPW